MCGYNVLKNLGGTTLTKEQTWENIVIIQGHWLLCAYGVWAIELKHTHEVIGRAGLLNPYNWA